MNLNEITEYSDPFKHWEIFNCLDKETLDEMVLASIPDGKRSYDGTRAADYTGEGIDGKLRLFIDKQNSSNFPNLTKLINFLQTQKISSLLGKLLKKNLSNSYVRLEVIGDKTGFWLKPHKDIEEKLMTMMIWANPYNESESLGTDLYNKDFKLI